MHLIYKDMSYTYFPLTVLTIQPLIVSYFLAPEEILSGILVFEDPS